MKISNSVVSLRRDHLQKKKKKVLPFFFFHCIQDVSSSSSSGGIRNYYVRHYHRCCSLLLLWHCYSAGEKWALCLHTHYTNSNINLKYNIYGEKVDSNEPRGAAAAMANTTAAAAASLCTHPCAFCSLLVMYCHTLLKPF